MLNVLVILTIFVMGVAMGFLAGIRCQEINLQRRERRLAEERRHVNAQICAIYTQLKANNRT